MCSWLVQFCPYHIAVTLISYVYQSLSSHLSGVSTWIVGENVLSLCVVGVVTVSVNMPVAIVSLNLRYALGSSDFGYQKLV